MSLLSRCCHRLISYFQSVFGDDGTIIPLHPFMVLLCFLDVLDPSSDSEPELVSWSEPAFSKSERSEGIAISDEGGGGVAGGSENSSWSFRV